MGIRLCRLRAVALSSMNSSFLLVTRVPSLCDYRRQQKETVRGAYKGKAVLIVNVASL